MKASTTKKLLIAAVAALSTVVVAGTTAFAVYTQRQLNRENTISVGKEVDTVILGAGANVTDPMYPGDTATITYDVDLENHKGGNVTVSWTLSQPDDFTVVVKQGETVVTANETALTDGALTFEITMTGDYDADNLPSYESVTLSVLLSVAGEQA